MNLINSGMCHKALQQMPSQTDPSIEVFPKGETQTFHITLHSIRKITVPAFPLILKITIIPSMQLSGIRERPGVTVFQLRMDNGVGGV